MEGLHAVIREFVAESMDNVVRLEVDLVALEQDPSSRELVSEIFRTFHTVKGTCGFLGFPRLESLAHAGESLLSDWRDGLIEAGSDTVDLLLRTVDALRRLLAAIDGSGTDDIEGDLASPVVDDITAYLLRARAAQPGPSALASLPKAGEAEPLPASDGPTPTGAARLSVETVRVGADVLDALVRQVGELVLTRNRLGRLTGEHRDPELVAVTTSLRGVVTELQATVMKTRMQPVSNAWQHVPRLVRELSASLGKTIDLQIAGGETELDRALIDSLRDPLTHVVRNAVDHGIESSEDRLAAGKPAAGRVSLRAFRQGGSLVVEVSDDGHGIDSAQVSQRAQALGLLTPEQVAELDDEEIVGVVFRPGFSTARALSHVSGRGVGMDAVRSALDALRGSVRLTTGAGEGTTCRLTLPVTLAITAAVTVTVAGQRFAIPQADLRELVRVDGGLSVVERISGAPVYRLRGTLLPLVVLGTELGLAGTDRAQVGTIAVLQVGGHALGLLVDGVLDTEEILVEPLDRRLGHLGAYVGAAILADGQVSLVLDVHAIAERAVPAVADASASQEAGQPLPARPSGDQGRQCLVAAVGGRRVALPMEGVARLEDFPQSTVETVQAKEFVQYGGSVVPFLRLAGYLDRRGSGPGHAPPAVLDRSVPAVVYRRGARSVVLGVDEIIDVVNECGVTDSAPRDGHAPATFVLDGRITELIDAHAALLAADPHFFDPAATPPGDHQREVTR